MEISIEKAIAAASSAGPAKLLELWSGWQRLGATAPIPHSSVLVAEALIGMARPEDALVVLQGAGDGLRATQLRALAKAKVGNIEDAIVALEGLRAQGALDAETGGLLGGRYKQRGLANDNAADLQAAYVVYLDTYEQSGDSYPGINAASLALTLGETEESVRIATRVLESVTLPPQQMDMWKFATRAEAHLLLRDLASARTWYRRAVGANPNEVLSIATMRRQARANLGALQLDEHALDDVLVVRMVAAFSGHMIDAPGRTPERFPASAEGAVRLAIRERLKQCSVGFGFSSMACGADVLFLEELLERGGSARVFLPFAYDRFLQTSVGQGWQSRVDAICADRRVTVTTLRDAPVERELEAAYAACSEAVTREATRFARRLGDEPVLLAVWNGEPGDGVGGTAETVRAWQGTGFRTEIIRPPTVTRSAEPPPRSPEPSHPASTTRDSDFTRGSRPRETKTFEYANRYCLCIGIREYQSAPWQPLPNARHDAEAVGRAFAEHQGFTDPIVLLDGDATAHRIATAITEELQGRASENDLVVVYFAGHGHTRRLGGQEHGFIVPANARGDAPSELVSVNQLSDWSTYLESLHLLYIFDSCFSGMFQRMAGGDRMNPDVTRARLAITSGQADQPVYDGGGESGHSVFTDGLLTALRDGVGGSNEFTVTELYSFLRRRVMERFPGQTPTLATLRNHEGGEILLRCGL